jgi:hypothetical protein
MPDEGSTAAEWLEGVVEFFALLGPLTRLGVPPLLRFVKACLVGEERCSPLFVSIYATRDIEGRNTATTYVHRRPILITLIPSNSPRITSLQCPCLFGRYQNNIQS